jgi:DNA-binding NtrC family response regulator
VFVLGKGSRLRYANAAWEQVAGVKLADSLGLVCTSRRHSSLLAVAMAPTPETLAGRPNKSRRAAPQHRSGPPWWDVSFVPLAGDDGAIGIVGFIEVVGEAGPAASRKIPAAVMALRDRHAGRFTFDLFAGHSSAAERFAGQLRLASQIAAPLWLLGEPGSGKETAARIIHHNGPRREKMFVALNGLGVQPFLLESLLWGHGGLIGSDRIGTIYLKEPAALPRDVQQRFVEAFPASGERLPSASVQLICGSNRPAYDDVKAGKLLPEFHTLFSVLELCVPPLRERLDDLPKLVSRLLARHADKPIEAKAVAVLKEHSWPGNLRELAAVLAEAAASSGTSPIHRDHLPRELREWLGMAKPIPEKPLNLDATLEAVEKRLIKLALAKANGNATRAAEMLGIWRTRLLRRVEALGLGERPAGERPA